LISVGQETCELDEIGQRCAGLRQELFDVAKTLLRLCANVALADDPSLRRQGRREERKGEAKDELNDAQDKAADKAQEVNDLERKT